MFIFNLAIADGLMGVYMIIIAAADMYFRDVYVFLRSLLAEAHSLQIGRVSISSVQ